MGAGALAAQLGVDLIGTAYGIYQDQRNFDYQKDLQKKLFEREDNAVQRRRADLEAAGMNPNLAAGSAAGAGQVAATGGISSRISTPDVLGNIIAFQQAKQQSVQLDEMKEDLEQRRIQNFYNRIAQIYDSSNGVSSKLVSSSGKIYEPYEVKWDDDGVVPFVFENGKLEYLVFIEDTPAWQQVKDTRNILKQNSEQSTIDTLSSKYDYDNISVDRWIDRISKGVGAVTDVGGLVTDIAGAVTARQRAGAYHGYEKSRRYK